MSAYMIVDLDIHDLAGFQSYRDGIAAFIAQFGGEYLVRGGDFEVIEGDWAPNRLVLFRFPDRQAIRNMFADPQYKKLAEARFRTAKSRIISVDGIA